jgi:hypothetical protein
MFTSVVELYMHVNLLPSHYIPFSVQWTKLLSKNSNNCTVLSEIKLICRVPAKVSTKPGKCF